MRWEERGRAGYLDLGEWGFGGGDLLGIGLLHLELGEVGFVVAVHLVLIGLEIVEGEEFGPEALILLEMRIRREDSAMMEFLGRKNC